MNDGVRIDGGAMYLTSLGQLELFRGTNITFQGNTGMWVYMILWTGWASEVCLLCLHHCSLGAALVGDTLFVPSVVSRLAFNPLCLMFYEDFFIPPNEWENVSLISSPTGLYGWYWTRILPSLCACVSRCPSVFLAIKQLSHLLFMWATWTSVPMWGLAHLGLTEPVHFDGTLWILGERKWCGL